MQKIQCPKCFTYTPVDQHICCSCGEMLPVADDTVSYDLDISLLQNKMAELSDGEAFAGRYTLIEELGRGGMGIVCKAKDRVLDTTVALKIIRPDLVKDSRFIKLFKDELLMARSITHENVIRIHDIGQEGQLKYISMDYIQGENLKELVQTGGSLSVKTMVDISRQIASALTAAHKNGIVHRDLKPQNIMVDRDGQAYVMDFGVAKSVEMIKDGKERKITGTPAYMSPEQAEGKKIDHRSDIYSLGLIMYEMATGIMPFSADTKEEYLSLQVHSTPELPSRLNPYLPQKLEKIVLKCIEKDPARRYQDAAGLLKDLKLVLGIKAGLRASPIKTVAVAAGLAATAFILFLVLKGFAPLQGAGLKQMAVLPFSNLTADSEFNHYSLMLQELLICDLEQSKHLQILPRESLNFYLGDVEPGRPDAVSSEALDRICRKEGVRYLILSSFMLMEDDLQVTVRIRDGKKRKQAGSETFQGPHPQGLNDLVDEIGPWIKSELMLSSREIKEDIDRELNQITTDSMDALRYYVEGKRLYLNNMFEESIKAYEKAVSLDPEFALAYAELGFLYIYMHQSEKAKHNLEKAMALKEGLSDREKHLIEARYYNILKNEFTKAVDTYKNYLAMNPNDIKTLEELAALYRKIEEWEAMEDVLYRLMSLGQETSDVLMNISQALQAQGRYEQALRFLLTHKENFAEENEYLRQRALCLINKGDYDKAFLELGKVIGSEPDNLVNHLMLGVCFHLSGSPEEAAREYKYFTSNENPVQQSYGYYWMMILDSMRGQNELRQRNLDRSLELARETQNDYLEAALLLWQGSFALKEKKGERYQPMLEVARDLTAKTGETYNEIIALEYLGRMDIQAGRVDEAEKKLGLIRNLIQRTGYRKMERYAYHLEGEMALADGRLFEATELFGKAYSFLPFPNWYYDEHGYFLGSLADACYLAGSLEEAEGYYRELIALRIGRLLWGWEYTKSHFMLGRIFQQQKNSIQAEFYYSTFLDLCSDADPGLAEVEEARQRLAEIRADSAVGFE